MKSATGTDISVAYLLDLYQCYLPLCSQCFAHFITMVYHEVFTHIYDRETLQITDVVVKRKILPAWVIRRSRVILHHGSYTSRLFYRYRFRYSVFGGRLLSLTVASTQ